MDLRRIKVAASPITGGINLYAHGDNPVRAIDQRDAEEEVLRAVVMNLLHNQPADNAVRTIVFGDLKFEITVKTLNS